MATPQPVKEHWGLVAYKTTVMGLIASMVALGLNILSDFKHDVGVLVERSNAQQKTMDKLESAISSKITTMCRDTDNLRVTVMNHDYRIEKLEGEINDTDIHAKRRGPTGP